MVILYRFELVSEEGSYESRLNERKKYMKKMSLLCLVLFTSFDLSAIANPYGLGYKSVGRWYQILMQEKDCRASEMRSEAEIEQQIKQWRGAIDPTLFPFLEHERAVAKRFEALKNEATPQGEGLSRYSSHHWQGRLLQTDQELLVCALRSVPIPRALRKFKSNPFPEYV